MRRVRLRSARLQCPMAMSLSRLPSLARVLEWGGGIEACTTTARCRGAPFTSSRFGSCAGMEGEIGGGGAGGCYGTVPPSPSPSMHSISTVVGHREATGNLLLENEVISLGSIRKKNHSGLIIAYLNINSIRNKFEFLKPLIADDVDVLTIAETKIDGTFTTSQFVLDGFSKPLRFDRN